VSGQIRVPADLTLDAYWIGSWPGRGGKEIVSLPKFVLWGSNSSANIQER